ncbi:MAG: beta-ketoacyl synthase N-terminal-like domain-containing protein [Thermodesulfobacteriota bacterium]|nr:beta-ketoacyl synthase N-terminal-like domain-containing protein [Thermodesulfobacteriota bacterium]
MNKVFIAHAGVITAFGHGLDNMYQNLLKAQDGFSRVTRFDTTPYVSSIAGIIPGLSLPVSGSKETAALDLAMDLIRELPENLFENLRTGRLISASTKGGIDLIRNCKLPSNFHPGLSGSGLPVSSLAALIALEMGIKQSSYNISAACASSTIAMAKAADLISRGREHTIAVLAQDLVTEFTFSGFSALGAMGPGPAMPFDQNRKGLTLGEGAALLILTNQDKLTEANLPALAELAGRGISGDAVHLTAPDRNASGLKAAISQACKTADIFSDSIGIISTHGTGTIYNDAMELTAIKDLFPPSIIANSIKGSIGHTLGAAGAIEVALCTKLLEQKILPGTKGLKTPEHGANPIFSPHNRSFGKMPILTTNSGFGGINAALIIQEAI